MSPERDGVASDGGRGGRGCQPERDVVIPQEIDGDWHLVRCQRRRVLQRYPVRCWWRSGMPKGEGSDRGSCGWDFGAGGYGKTGIDVWRWRWRGARRRWRFRASGEIGIGEGERKWRRRSCNGDSGMTKRRGNRRRILQVGSRHRRWEGNRRCRGSPEVVGLLRAMGSRGFGFTGQRGKKVGGVGLVAGEDGEAGKVAGGCGGRRSAGVRERGDDRVICEREGFAHSEREEKDHRVLMGLGEREIN